MSELKKKNIIVTGSTGVIGNSIVKKLYELDANILADVYFNLTGGQKNMDFSSNNQSAEHHNDPNQRISQEKIEEIVAFKLSG